jgi:hypothetical protein
MKTDITNKTRVFELHPKNGRKSFYGKATICEQEQRFDLYSYKTLVARWDEKEDKMLVTGNEEHLTNTTISHIKSFFLFCGKGETNKQHLIKNVAKL